MARLHRAGELTGVWTPDAAHEAVRDLVRAREAAADDLRRKRQQLLSFLLRHSRITTAEAAIGRWRIGAGWPIRSSSMSPSRSSFRKEFDVIEDALQRLRRLEKQLTLIVPDWSMAPVVDAYQAMRGASFLVAVTFAAEIGDVRRFDTPRQLMSFLGLVPAESSTGDTVRRKGLTLAGNRRARRALVEAAWTYPLSGQSWRDLESPVGRAAEARARHRLEGPGPSCARYRRLSATGKEFSDRRRSDCSRDCGVPVGDRTRGRAGVRANPLFLFSAAQSREWSTKGGELPSLVMWPDCRPTPVL